MKAGLPSTGDYVPASPSRSPSNRRSAVLIRKRGWLTAGYGVFAIILFIAFVTASFPYADTISVLLAPIRMKVDFQRQALRFPIGARLEDVRLFSSADEQLLLESPNVTVSPGIAWFLLGQPCIKIHAQIYGGVMETTVRQSGKHTIVDFELDSLDLAGISGVSGGRKVEGRTGTEDGGALYQSGLILGGQLSASGSAQLMGTEVVADRGSMILSGRDVKAVIVNGLPPLELGAVHGKVLLQQGVATLQNLTANGPDGDLAANGEVRIAADIAHSTVQLTLSLRPSAKARASFGLLLNMLPHAPGEGPYYVQGMLMFPSLS
jgi:type II secretion system protein N